jgi:TRAP-type C4-dicarboxylate transport system permease large subunit
MVTTVLGIFIVHTVEVWIWAFAHLMTGVVSSLEDAVYFSTVTFSTLGYGDITPPLGWRVFAALESMNGFILIGWSIAYLIAASTRHGPFRIGEHF